MKQPALLSFFQNFWVSNILFLILGLILPKMLGFLKQRYLRFLSRRNRTSYIERLDEKLNIITLAYGNPSFSAVKINPSDGFFTLIYSNYTAEDKTLVEERIDTLQLCELFNVRTEDFWNRFEEVKNSTYDDFLNSRNGKYFNGQIYGVYASSNFVRSADKRESAEIVLNTYQTDYFTMSVLTDVLKAVNNGGVKLDKSNLANELKYFRNSIGVNIVLILPSSNEIVLTERSQNSSYANNLRTVYPSAVETLSIADDEADGIGLNHCVVRGIHEELGLCESDLDISTVRIFSMFYESNYYQDNFVACVKAKEHVNLKYINDKLAKDGLLEVKKVFTIADSTLAIKKFLEENSGRVQYQTHYTLEIYVKLSPDIDVRIK